MTSDQALVSQAEDGSTIIEVKYRECVVPSELSKSIKIVRAPEPKKNGLLSVLANLVSIAVDIAF